MSKSKQFTTAEIVIMTKGSWTETIADRLVKFGASVWIVSPQVSKKEIARCYDEATHVLLPGGSDIHPSLYGEPVGGARAGDRERDLLELDLATRALRDGKPLMGICRGHQMVCVAAGGKLVQDVEMAGAARWHEGGSHPVLVEQDGLLGLVLHQQEWVNSYHHQAVKKMPKGWRVTAVSDDGVAEGIEHKTLPVVSVQWHPEAMVDRGHDVLFELFLNMKAGKVSKAELARLTRKPPTARQGFYTPRPSVTITSPKPDVKAKAEVKPVPQLPPAPKSHTDNAVTQTKQPDLDAAGAAANKAKQDGKLGWDGYRPWWEDAEIAVRATVGGRRSLAQRTIGAAFGNYKPTIHGSDKPDAPKPDAKAGDKK